MVEVWGAASGEVKNDLLSAAEVEAVDDMEDACGAAFHLENQGVGEGRH
jgi:hypothetical protein